MADGNNEHPSLGDLLRPHDEAEAEFNTEFPNDEPFHTREAETSFAPVPPEEPAPPAAPAPEAAARKNPALTVRKIMIGVFLLVMLISGVKLATMMINYYKLDKGYEDLAAEMVSTPPPTPEPTPAPEDGETAEPEPPKETAPIVVDTAALLERNPDFIGWLYCEDTPIDFALVYSGDNWTYMGWNFDRQGSVYGWTFMDYRCNSDFSSLLSTIYGHNMQNGSVFAVLEKYQKQEFYDEHPVMWLITPEHSFKVRLFAGTYLYGTEDAYGGFDGNEQRYRAFLRDAVAASTFVTDVDITETEHTLMLSTCSNTRPDMRYVVLGTLEPLDE